MKRGIFLAIISVALVAALLFYYYSAADVYSSVEKIPAQYSHSLAMGSQYDDIGTDLCDLYGVRYSLSSTNTTTMHSFAFSPVKNLTASSGKYISFLRGYSNITQRNITAAFQNRTLDIVCGDSGLNVHKNYTLNDTQVYLSSQSLVNVSIYLAVNDSLSSFQPWSNTGSTPVRLRVVSNGSESINVLYYLSKTATNRYTLNYSGRLVYIDFGDIGKGLGIAGVRVLGNSTSNFLEIQIHQNSSFSAGKPCYFSNSSLNVSTYPRSISGSVQVPTYR